MRQEPIGFFQRIKEVRRKIKRGLTQKGLIQIKRKDISDKEIYLLV